MYRPPDTRMSEFTSILSQLDKLLCELPEPTPNIVLMGDFNFPNQHMSWVRSDDGHLLPIVHGHREDVHSEGVHVRQQAAKLSEFALKHNLIQHVDKVTHGNVNQSLWLGEALGLVLMLDLMLSLKVQSHLLVLHQD